MDVVVLCWSRWFCVEVSRWCWFGVCVVGLEEHMELMGGEKQVSSPTLGVPDGPAPLCAVLSLAGGGWPESSDSLYRAE